MAEILGFLIVILMLIVIGLLWALLRRQSTINPTVIEPMLEDLQSAHEKAQERTERTVRDEMGRNREEAATLARQSREELAGSLKNVGDTLNQQLLGLTKTNLEKLDAMRETVEQRLQRVQTDSGQRLDALRATLDDKLKAIQQDNTAKLEQMRQTVDEKLQGTLEKRLGESFKLVSERLEQVSRGLGEMQVLASGVGDLKRVLTNVKTRGIWGEVQLAALLEEVLTPDQYAANVATKEGSLERVEFAIKLPGRGDDPDEFVWLPIDAKFPIEDYQRLIDAQEQANPDAAESASRQLEVRIRGCASAISGKYVNPPRTTDFGILFLPTEGLFAEVMRRPGLADAVQRESRVVIAGPTTLWAILSSLQMGFRTLAIQKRSGEVWSLLAAVKTEFGKYEDVLRQVQKNLDSASKHLDSAVTTRTRAIQRKLQGVQELPTSADAQQFLLLGADVDDEDEDEGPLSF